jgi:hypothetical protein
MAASVHGAMEAPAESTLLSCIQESIALHLFDNAKFLAERLVASYPSEVKAYIQRCVLFGMLVFNPSYADLGALSDKHLPSSAVLQALQPDLQGIPCSTRQA